MDSFLYILRVNDRQHWRKAELMFFLAFKTVFKTNSSGMNETGMNESGMNESAMDRTDNNIINNLNDLYDDNRLSFEYDNNNKKERSLSSQQPQL